VITVSTLRIVAEPKVDDWDPWTPAEVARLLDGVDVTWWVAGGWALDLWRGRQTRAHGDIEIGVPRGLWEPVRRRLAGYELWCARDGALRPLAPDAEVPDADRQVWVRDRTTGAFRLDVMLDPGDRDTWVSHRHRGLRLPLGEAVAVSPDGVPYLRPEIVLLLKAAHVRTKDEADLAACLPLLDTAARRWLAGALAERHPGHPWLGRV
jgi:hypothetical protein